MRVYRPFNAPNTRYTRRAGVAVTTASGQYTARDSCCLLRLSRAGRLYSHETHKGRGDFIGHPSVYSRPHPPCHRSFPVHLSRAIAAVQHTRRLPCLSHGIFAREVVVVVHAELLSPRQCSAFAGDNQTHWHTREPACMTAHIVVFLYQPPHCQ